MTLLNANYNTRAIRLSEERNFQCLWKSTLHFMKVYTLILTQEIPVRKVKMDKNYEKGALKQRNWNVMQERRKFCRTKILSEESLIICIKDYKKIQ